MGKTFWEVICGWVFPLVYKQLPAEASLWLTDHLIYRIGNNYTKSGWRGSSGCCPTYVVWADLYLIVLNNGSMKLFSPCLSCGWLLAGVLEGRWQHSAWWLQQSAAEPWTVSGWRQLGRSWGGRAAGLVWLLLSIKTTRLLHSSSLPELWWLKKKGKHESSGLSISEVAPCALDPWPGRPTFSTPPACCLSGACLPHRSCSRACWLQGLPWSHGRAGTKVGWCREALHTGLQTHLNHLETRQSFAGYFQPGNQQPESVWCCRSWSWVVSKPTSSVSW